MLVELRRRGQAELVDLRGGALYWRREALGALDPDGLRSALADPARLILTGTLDDHVVGYGMARRQALADGSTHGLVEALYVQAEARSLGVGEAMMDAMMEWFAGQGCQGVDVTVLPGHRAAKSFLESAGFKARLIVMHRRIVP